MFFQEHTIVTTGKTIDGSSIPWLDQCNCGQCKVNLAFVTKNNSLNTSDIVDFRKITLFLNVQTL